MRRGINCGHFSYQNLSFKSVSKDIPEPKYTEKTRTETVVREWRGGLVRKALMKGMILSHPHLSWNLIDIYEKESSLDIP